MRKAIVRERSTGALFINAWHAKYGLARARPICNVAAKSRTRLHAPTPSEPRQKREVVLPSRRCAFSFHLHPTRLSATKRSSFGPAPQISAGTSTMAYSSCTYHQLHLVDVVSGIWTSRSGHRLRAAEDLLCENLHDQSSESISWSGHPFPWFPCCGCS